MQSKKKFGSFAGKGYYIALILCASAIGISGYLYYRNMTIDDTLSNDPIATVGVGNTGGEDVQAGASQPGGNGDDIHHDAMDVTNPTQTADLKTCLPLTGETIADYAMECLAYNATTRDWRVHDGIDIAADAGTTVCAAAEGTVYTTYSDGSMGMTVVIRHTDGYVTVYSSLAEELLVKVGDTVQMGQAIGTVGNTAMLETAIGDHLHFSVTCNGESVDPEDFFDLD